MFTQILIAVISLVAGWYGRDILERATRFFIKYERKRDNELFISKGASWLINYYTKLGHGASLFCLDNGRKIPYLTQSNWHFPLLKESSASATTLVSYRSALPVDQRAVKRRQSSGQRIWDDQVLCLAGMVERGDVPTVALGTCSYFQYISASDSLYAEAVRSLKRPDHKTPIRDAKASSLEHLSQGLLEAQIAGFTTALVLTLHGKRQVLIQKRSAATGVASNKLAVVPAFVANSSQVVGAHIEPARLLFYIELLEELFDREELIAALKRPSMDWILDTWPVGDLERSLDHSFTFTRLGFGFDAATGEFHQAYLAFVESPETSHELVRKMSGSWELDSVSLHEIDSKELRDMTEGPSMYPTSAFTLTLAHEWFMHHGRVASS